MSQMSVENSTLESPQNNNPNVDTNQNKHSNPVYLANAIFRLPPGYEAIKNAQENINGEQTEDPTADPYPKLPLSETQVGSFEVELVCEEPLETPLNLTVCYVVDPKNTKDDQILAKLTIPALKRKGKFKFTIKPDKPIDYTKLTQDQLLGSTLIIIQCKQGNTPLTNIGFIVNTEYEDLEMNLIPPVKTDFSMLFRQIISQPIINQFSAQDAALNNMFAKVAEHEEEEREEEEEVTENSEEIEKEESQNQKNGQNGITETGSDDGQVKDDESESLGESTDDSEDDNEAADKITEEEEEEDAENDELNDSAEENIDIEPKKQKLSSEESSDPHQDQQTHNLF